MTQQPDLIVEDDDTVANAPAPVVVEEGSSPVIVDDGDDDGAPQAPPPWIVNPNGTRTLPLVVPVTYKIKSRADGTLRDEKITELQFRRFSGGDMLALANLGDNTEAIIREIFRRFTGLHDSIYTLLDQEDVMNLHDLVEDFLPKPRKGGKATSAS